MQQNREKKDIQLSEDDRIRMEKLFEEVKGRLTEMSYIVARYVGLDPDSHRTTFHPKYQELNDRVQLLEGIGDRSSSACYSYRSGTVSPCGDPNGTHG